MNILITYATKEFKQSLQTLEKSALRFGMDKVIAYGPENINKTDFYKQHAAVFEQKKGAGLWLWKPYILKEALKNCTEEDVLFYCDAGIEIVSSLLPLVYLLEKKADQKILLFSASKYLNCSYTKRDCFVLMNADEPYYYHSQHCMGGFLVIRKNTFTLSFLEEWLTYASDHNILTDQPNTCGLPDLPEFISHRHDQSILSILAARYKLEIYRDPSQWGNHLKLPEFRNNGEFLSEPYKEITFLNSPYETLLNIHRSRDINLLDKLSLLKNKLPKFR